MTKKALPQTDRIGLTLDEVARALGLSRDAVLALRRRPSNPLPAFTYGTRWVYPRREVVEWAADEATRQLNTPKDSHK